MRARLSDSAGRAAVLVRRAAALFPVRVWRRFLQRNGTLLSAGMAYQGVFALFALLYVAFASAGVWLGGSTSAVQALIRAANSYLPGIISEHGIADPDEVQQIVGQAGAAFTTTGLIAVAVAIWTATGAVTFTRRAVRDIFGLPPAQPGFVLLKLRDALGALGFAASLLLGALLSLFGVWALTRLVELAGWDLPSGSIRSIVSAGSVIVIIAIDTTAIALLVHFLIGTTLPWRTIWPGALVGGATVTMLQLGIGLIFARSPGNPLLATFAVMVALLLWCRLVAAVVLLSATWIAVRATDRGELRPPAPRAGSVGAGH
ncbi:YihY/virulence factor BrkB family protein [Microbacterium sp. ARD32]|uniref:YihY/virulence factor BrkB family protein n=1 Tax=Microbacterium sp. ARD32 TaxID=2962577 RepID=UPI002881382D|nr:YihY/virulence factor BrkB family protein [Microbacterium sp. ARD32]MDT0158685.1 YihY/virulence factor BrkB family protein [Microbacterium sp. ARD32]